MSQAPRPGYVPDGAADVVLGPRASKHVIISGHVRAKHPSIWLFIEAGIVLSFWLAVVLHEATSVGKPQACTLSQIFEA
jgi:hypothetical protein